MRSLVCVFVVRMHPDQIFRDMVNMNIRVYIHVCIISKTALISEREYRFLVQASYDTKDKKMPCMVIATEEIVNLFAGGGGA